MDNSKSIAKTEIDPNSPPISISIIYKDAKSREEAAKLCRRLAHNLKAEFKFRLNWWPFESLGEADTAKAASLATARADMVIVSTRGGRELPAKVKSWMEACLLKRKSQDAALVALVRMAKDLKAGALPVLAFLCSVAEHAKMDYLPEIIYPVRG